MNLYINDGKGIFSLNMDKDSLVSGEYEVDEKGANKLDLYTSELYPVFYDVATDYVYDFDGSVNETTITNKAWKIAFIQSIGFTTNSYVSLEYIQEH